MKCADYYVVSIDTAAIPRIVFGPMDEDACDCEAERYWNHDAQAGDEVHIMCKHNEVMRGMTKSN